MNALQSYEVCFFTFSHCPRCQQRMLQPLRSGTRKGNAAHTIGGEGQGARANMAKGKTSSSFKEETIFPQILMAVDCASSI